jgi:hypothetical protein
MYASYTSQLIPPGEKPIAAAKNGHAVIDEK